MKQITFTYLVSFLFAFFLIGCGATQPIRTLEEGKSSVISSFGGPVIPFANLPIPVPYLNLGYAKGMQKNLTVFGNAHITALLFKNVALDGGMVTTLTKEKGIKPEITVKLQGNFFWAALRDRAFRFIPSANVNGSYKIGERSLAYAGADNVYEFSSSQYLISPFLGYQFPLSHSLLGQVETKWIAANQDTRHGVFEGYASVHGKGNLGIFFALTYELE